MRDESRCVNCGSSFSLTVQHRQAVGMGGSKHKPAEHELVTACLDCNTRFEQDLQTAALRFGWKVPRWVDDPSRVPVFWAWWGYWFSLHGGGLVWRTEEEAIALMRDVYGDQYDEWREAA